MFPLIPPLGLLCPIHVQGQSGWISVLQPHLSVSAQVVCLRWPFQLALFISSSRVENFGELWSSTDVQRSFLLWITPFLSSALKNLVEYNTYFFWGVSEGGQSFTFYLFLSYAFMHIIRIWNLSRLYNFESLLDCVLFPFLFNGLSSAKYLYMHLTQIF